MGELFIEANSDKASDGVLLPYIILSVEMPGGLSKHEITFSIYNATQVVEQLLAELELHNVKYTPGQNVMGWEGFLSE